MHFIHKNEENTCIFTCMELSRSTRQGKRWELKRHPLYPGDSGLPEASPLGVSCSGRSPELECTALWLSSALPVLREPTDVTRILTTCSTTSQRPGRFRWPAEFTAPLPAFS